MIYTHRGSVVITCDLFSYRATVNKGKHNCYIKHTPRVGLFTGSDPYAFFFRSDHILTLRPSSESTDMMEYLLEDGNGC